MFPAANENGGKVAVQDSAEARDDDDDDAEVERLEDFTPKRLATAAAEARGGRSDWSVPPPPP